RSLFNLARKTVNNDEKGRRYRQRQYGEAPVEIEHHRDHANERQHLNDQTQQRLGNETLNRVDVAGDSRDQVTCSFVIVIRERQTQIGDLNPRLHNKARGARQRDWADTSIKHHGVRNPTVKLYFTACWRFGNSTSSFILSRSPLASIRTSSGL